MPERSSGIAERLAHLGRAFLARSRGEASRLSELQQVLLTSDAASAAAAVGEIEAIAHRLRGTAGTLGFAEVSEAAARIEDAAAVFSGPGVPVAPNAGSALSEPIAQLVTMIEDLAG